MNYLTTTCPQPPEAPESLLRAAERRAAHAGKTIYLLHLGGRVLLVTKAEWAAFYPGVAVEASYDAH